MLSLGSLLLVFALNSLINPGLASGQKSELQVDASSFEQPGKTSYRGGSSVSPSGHSLGMNSRFLIRDGRPWLPVMGEFHYTRVPKTEWEEQILKMKAAGVSVIATYVIWIHHEEVEGQFDWDGLRNLRGFAQLCAKHGMYLYVRIGPWAHGEVRNGGFPDWLLKKTENTRRNDPAYLSYVSSYFQQIAAQLRGLLWKDGGPVIGVQLENEYAKAGTGAGNDHILELKHLAIESGLDVPLYSVTGWDNSVVPKGEVVAVFGGYPDAPWGDSLSVLPPQEVYAFRFGGRVTGNMGAIGVSQGLHGSEKDFDFPFMTAEMGGGIQDTYHRRPVLSPDDIAAMVPVMLGSGVNLYGSYMFQGGENPDGKLTTLQESQATGYPTDVPVKSYDFQAPLGEFGQERLVLRKLKTFNYFMEDFGPLLAPMETYPPSTVPSSPADLSVARISVRANGNSGFLFFNNYVRQSETPPRSAFQIKVKLRNQNISIPDQPITLPSGVYGIWPINMGFGDSKIRYATAQPLAKIENGHDSKIYFVETPGVRPEFVFEAPCEIEVTKESGAILRKDHDRSVVSGMSSSLVPAFSIKHGDGSLTSFVVLSQDQAENFWRIDADGKEGAIVSTSDFYADGSAVTLDAIGNPDFKFEIVPRTEFHILHQGTVTQRSPSGSDFEINQRRLTPKLTVQKVAEARAVPPVKLGPMLPWRTRGVAVAPDNSAFKNSAKWNLTIPADAWKANGLFLVINYDGDVARLKSGDKLLVDNFYNGTPWTVGLDRFRDEIKDSGLQLEILPRRTDAPVYIGSNEAAPNGENAGQIMNLSGIDLIPKYEISFQLRSAR